MAKPTKVPGIFRVDGVTMKLCEKLAAKKCELFLVKDKQPTPSEYENEFNRVSANLFKSLKPKCVSQTFSTPTLANEYRELLKATTPPNEYRDLSVMIRVPAQTKSGGIKRNEKTNKVTMVWEKYDDQKDYEQPLEQQSFIEDLKEQAA